MICNVAGIILGLSLMVLSVYLLKSIIDIYKAYNKKDENPIKEGDILVLFNYELKCYNICFLVKKAYEGYYIGTMYSLTSGKKRKCDLVTMIMLSQKGFSYTGMQEFCDISFTDDDIEKLGFERV